MSDGDLAVIESHAVEYARRVGDLLMSYFRQPVEIEFKGDKHRETVSIVDREAERLIRESIQRDFPDHAILGEEGTEQSPDSPEYLWVVDPLDGTTNFLNHIPFFASSIGVLHRLEPAVGAIFAPCSPLGGPAVFHARRGGGAFLDDMPLHVSRTTRATSADLSAVPARYREWVVPSKELRRNEGELRTLGSIADEMALVAAGGLLYCVYGGPRIWDVAAGVTIVKEAGGTCLEFDMGRGAWQPLARFNVGGEEGPIPERLRRWSRHLVVGNEDVAWFVARNLRRRRWILGRLLKLFGRG